MSEDMIRQQAERLAALLPRLRRHLFGFSNDDLAKLTMAQFRVCMLLNDGPQPMSCLSHQLGISLSAVTQSADRLEKTGLVERVPDEEDRRVRILQLTPEGVEIMRKRRERRIERAMEVLEAMPEETRAQVLLALETLARTASEVHASINADVPLPDENSRPMS